MKGLLRNYLYAVEKNLKLYVIINCIVILFSVIIVTISSNFYPIALILINGQPVLFGMLATAALHSDFHSKWNKLEIAMPISHKNIVKARYISFLIYATVGFVLLLVGRMLLSFNNEISNLSLRDLYTFGVFFSILYPSVLYPLLLLFGIDKISVVSPVSICISISICLVILITPAIFLKGVENASIILSAIQFPLTLFVFTLLYFISSVICKNKEIS